MKKLSIYMAFSMLFMLGSCADENLQPILTFDQAGKGGYVKLLELVKGEYDLKDFAGSVYQCELEFVDIDKGNHVTSYDVYASHNGGTEALWKSFGQSDFKQSDRDFKAMTLTIPLSEIATLLGLAESDLAAGDQFLFSGELTLDDGSKFRQENSSAAVNGSAFGGHFDFVVKATCPLPDDKFTGSYTLTYDGDAGTGYGIPFEEGTFDVVVRSGSTTRRIIQGLTYLPGIGGYGPYDMGFDIVCDQVVAEAMDSGLGCGDGSIVVDQVPGEVSPIADLADDSQFVLIVDEGAKTGGCGSISSTVTRIVFTKN